LERERADVRCLNELRDIFRFRPALVVDYDPDVHRAELVGR
jgi:hypothetical protein